MAKSTESIVRTVLKSEVTFLITIITLVVGIAISFSKMDARVLANEKDIEEHNEILFGVDTKIDEVLIKQAQMAKDIDYLVERNKQND